MKIRAEREKTEKINDLEFVCSAMYRYPLSSDSLAYLS